MTTTSARELAPEPPPVTGIDYLGLVEARDAAELATRIDYSGLVPATPAGCPGELTIPEPRNGNR